MLGVLVSKLYQRLFTLVCILVRNFSKPCRCIICGIHVQDTALDIWSSHQLGLQCTLSMNAQTSAT